MSRPYAAPLAAVDRVTRRPDGAFDACKRVVATDPYLVGHYPGGTIYPGVFTIETVYQAARHALAEHINPAGHRADIDLASVESVRFTAPVLPGDVLQVHGETAATDEPALFRVSAHCVLSDGTLAARMTITVRVSPDA